MRAGSHRPPEIPKVCSFGWARTREDFVLAPAGPSNLLPYRRQPNPLFFPQGSLPVRKMVRLLHRCEVSCCRSRVGEPCAGRLLRSSEVKRAGAALGRLPARSPSVGRRSAASWSVELHAQEQGHGRCRVPRDLRAGSSTLAAARLATLRDPRMKPSFRVPSLTWCFLKLPGFH